MYLDWCESFLFVLFFLRVRNPRLELVFIGVYLRLFGKFCCILREKFLPYESMPANFCLACKKKFARKSAYISYEHKLLEKNPRFEKNGESLVRMTGLEPAHLTAQEPKSCVSANFTTSACMVTSLVYHVPCDLSTRFFYCRCQKNMI